MSKQKAKPLSRAVRTKMVSDLVKQLADHAETTEAIMVTEWPNGSQTVLEHHLRTVFMILLGSQQKRLREIEGLARILAERT